KN
ncbi:hypothetical protein D046_2719B, partial [Vibrio parahaemolyticus V-223/04]